MIKLSEFEDPFLNIVKDESYKSIQCIACGRYFERKDIFVQEGNNKYFLKHPFKKAHIDCINETRIYRLMFEHWLKDRIEDLKK